MSLKNQPVDLHRSTNDKEPCLLPTTPLPFIPILGERPAILVCKIVMKIRSKVCGLSWAPSGHLSFLVPTYLLHGNRHRHVLICRVSADQYMCVGALLRTAAHCCALLRTAAHCLLRTAACIHVDTYVCRPSTVSFIGQLA